MIEIKAMDTMHLNNNSNYYNFARIFNCAFPSKIEQEYVRLTNLIIKYMTLSNALVIDSKNSANSLDSINEKIKEISNSLNSETSLYTYLYLRNLINNACKSIKMNSEKQNEDFNIESISKLREEIIAQLQTISNFNINNQKRIDGLSVKEKHLMSIEELDISIPEKNVLKALLIEFFNLRVASFKTIEAFANELMLKLQNGEELSDESLFDYYFAVISLYSVDIQIIIDNLEPNLTLLEKLENECKIMNLVTTYFQTKSISSESIKEIEGLLSSFIDYDFKSLLQYLIKAYNHLSDNFKLN